MTFYEGCSDDTFEMVEDWFVECVLCGERYLICRDDLHITVMEQGDVNEHYFFADRFRCRNCGEELFVRVKLYDRDGKFERITYKDCDVDFIRPPRFRTLRVQRDSTRDVDILTNKESYHADQTQNNMEVKNMSDFFYMQEYVDKHFASGVPIDHEVISNSFVRDIHSEMDDERFEKLLIVSGFIPDLYSNDSSEETLFTKLVEGLVSEWSVRIGAQGELIKQKASYEDVKITIAGKVVVCDAKSFRLGRSQQAPNAKDFLKLEDIRKWMDRYPSSIGGLVTYPCKHEWTGKSDIYQYCSTKDAPTVMLPYKYLAYLLHYKNNYTPKELTALWDYETLFPQKLTKNVPGGNKVAYWRVIDAAICRITKTSSQQLRAYMRDADALINECVAENLERIGKIRQGIIDRITESIEAETDVDAMKKKLIAYQIGIETDLLNKIIQRIKDFR